MIELKDANIVKLRNQKEQNKAFLNIALKDLKSNHHQKQEAFNTSINKMTNNHKQLGLAIAESNKILFETFAVRYLNSQFKKKEEEPKKPTTSGIDVFKRTNFSYSDMKIQNGFSY